MSSIGTRRRSPSCIRLSATALDKSSSTTTTDESDDTTTTPTPVITRTAPGAGRTPPWETRNPQPSPPSAAHFLQSDRSQPDVGQAMWECPLTRWDYPNPHPHKNDISDDSEKTFHVAQAQRQARNAARVAACPLELCATPAMNAQGADYFLTHAQSLRAQLLQHGAIWFRNFDLMQTVPGFRTFYEALSLEPCLDPLHSSGLRKFASERDAIYEEVNKASLRNHYIGLHCESTTKRTAAYAAFVCFQKATHGGGRFLVADGAAILAELDSTVLQRLVDRQIRISVSNLDLPPALPSIVKQSVQTLVSAAVAPKFDMDLEMLFEKDGTPGRLQAMEIAESPINLHPVSGVPVWFNNAHNHARALRDRRPCGVPEVGMTDVFYADTLTPLSLDDCLEIQRASEAHICALPMEPGDVLLVDNYRALHGRDVFQGERFHAVSWFTWDDTYSPHPEWRGKERRIVEKNALNKVINQMMDWLPKDFESNQSK